MLVSVIIPACAAQATIARAVSSVLIQTFTAWEAVIVSDDGVDYAAFLADSGIRDPRLTFVSTGLWRSGCHNARNIGLAAAQGDFIAALDADDIFAPERLAILVPPARDHGAAVDNAMVVSEATGAVIARALGENPPARLDADHFFDFNVPLFPVMRRDHAQPRLAGVEYAEDVVANLRLIDRMGALPVIPRALSDYRVMVGSMCHAGDSVAIFDRVYGELLDRLEHGDGLDLSPSAQVIAGRGLTRKRAFNGAFKDALGGDPTLNFQTFAAGHRHASASQAGPQNLTPGRPGASPFQYFAE